MLIGRGIVVDGASAAQPVRSAGTPASASGTVSPMAQDIAFSVGAAYVSPHPVRWLRLMIAAALLAFALTRTPHQPGIAPLIESDYAYQLMAADRLYVGQGLTSLQPVAPHQTWNWQYDWGFLTQWPVGYAAIVAGLRTVVGGTSLHSAQLISVLACAFGLVGWFAVVLRAVPTGTARYLLGLLVGGVSVPIASLINPSTDAIMLGVLPFLILTVSAALEPPRAHRAPPGVFRWLVIGLACGSLVWIRYAAVFVSAGVGLYALLVWILSRRIAVRDISAYTVGAGLPIAALLITNRVMSGATSVQSQMNLGSKTSAAFSLDLLAIAWTKWTNLGLYDHRPEVVAGLAWYPLALGVAWIFSPKFRRAVRQFLSTPTVGLSACLVVSLLTMLVVVTALFGEKFPFVGLDRYYLPGKPLYGILFFAPLLWVRARVVRAGCAVTFLLGLVFVAQVSWSRPLQRWHDADRPSTPYGAWSRAFEPDARALFAWIRSHGDRSLVVVSNFHEYVALETGCPTLPIPADRATLDRWLASIALDRGVDHLRVVFALEPDNQWRDYWIPAPSNVRRTFSLTPFQGAPGTAIHPCLFTYEDRRAVAAGTGVTPEQS